MTEPQDRRELIVATAAEMFARKGIKATTVREIADAVGVLSGSLYHYFKSKDEIVQEILVEFLEETRARYAEVLGRGDGVAETLRELVLASLRVASQRPYATAIYQNQLQYLIDRPEFKEGSAEVQRVWLELIARGVAEGVFRDDISPRVFYRLIRDAVWMSWCDQHSDKRYSIEQLADAITSVFLDGFVARPDRVTANAL
jgi:TetR/AcrR family transcriptional regulator, cholesterol catabolism regulator